VNEGDPRVRRTRKLLVDAFMALLAEKGFHAITVQDVAERATVNRATFYAHFEDKYALMDWVVRDGVRQALQQRLGAAPPFTLGNLHLLVVTVCEYLGQFHGHCAPPTDRDLDPLMLETKVQQELHAFLLAWLRDARPACVTSAADREVVAVVMSWATFGAGIQWSRGERTIPADEWARQVVTVLIGGASQAVTVPPGAAQARGRAPVSAGNGARGAHR
jgi:AcrR family transcriptional regulator